MYEDAYSVLKNSDCDFFDIYKEDSFTRLIEAKNKKVDNVKIGYDSGVGVRLVRGLSTMFSSTYDYSEESVFSVAKFLADGNQNTNQTFEIIPIKEKDIESYGGVNPKVESVSEIFDIFNTVCYKYNQIKQVSLTFSDKTKVIEIINEQGEHVKETRDYIVFFVELTAKNGDIIQTSRRPFGALGGFEFLKGFDFNNIAFEMSEKLIELVLSPALPAKNMSVVLSAEAGGTMIHEAVGHGLEADLVYESLSVYKDKLNTKVANKKITVVDDATRPKMRGSFAFDDEGTPSQNTVLIENGILKNYMFDKTYAKVASLSSTGNSRRESYRFAPIVRMSNTYILPGSDNPDDIIASVDEGLLVKHMGGGQVNPITGDFVFEVNEGYLIERGRVKNMVRGATLVGNGPKVLEEIDMVGSDFGVEVGTCGKGAQGVPVTDGEPTLRIPSILVGGSAL
jgi:TldD protein